MATNLAIDDGLLEEARRVGGLKTKKATVNRCWAKGIQGSNTDFLLCAVALRRKIPILTTDDDFQCFAKHLRVELHEPR